MSWHHEANHKTKAAAKTHAAKNLVYAPEHVRAAVAAAIDALPDQEGAIHVKTQGHIDQINQGDGKHWGASSFRLELDHTPFPHD